MKKVDSTATGTIMMPEGVVNKSHFMHVTFKQTPIDLIIKTKGLLDLMTTYTKTNQEIIKT